jgi:hypothetical protein
MVFARRLLDLDPGDPGARALMERFEPASE